MPLSRTRSGVAAVAAVFQGRPAGRPALQASERMLPARGPFADGSSSKLTR
jgi:hypothetical protein